VPNQLCEVRFFLFLMPADCKIRVFSRGKAVLKVLLFFREVVSLSKKE